MARHLEGYHVEQCRLHVDIRHDQGGHIIGASVQRTFEAFALPLYLLVSFACHSTL
ncbi:MAG: hypothetical protein ACYC8W_07840 [Candidatus Tyrphobacter sp.]